MAFVRQAIELAVVVWLPGALIFRLPWLDRDRRAALDAEERLFWAVVISISVSLAVVLLLAAGHRYSFSRLLLADLAVAAIAAAIGRRNLAMGAAARRPGLSALIPLALLLLGLWRFFPASEYVIGGKDPGTYMNEGIQLAQKQALVIHDPVVASVPAFARDLFFPSHHREWYYGVRFMGFFIKDPDAGTVIGQFPHLFPASIAVGYGLDGLTGARRTVGVWAVLGVLAVYFAGARLIGRRAAAAAAVLLSLNVIQVWFARYPNAEVVMQALLFAALLANARAHYDGDPFFAPVAAVLLGLLLFLRFDAVLGVAGVFAGLVLSAMTGRRPAITFGAIFAIIAVVAAMYLIGPMRWYADPPIVFFRSLPVPQRLVLGALALASAAACWTRYGRALGGPVARWAPLAATAVLWVLASYALVLREPGGRLTAYDAYALRTFTYFYLSLPALLAALMGFALLARQGFWRDPSLLMTIAIFSCFLFYKIRIVPEHFWLARRFLPVILPGALLLASAAALGGWRSGPARLVRAAIGVAFVGVLGWHYARVSAPVLPHVEYAGLIPRLEQLANGVRDNDLLVVEGRNAGGDIHVLGLPLAYIYARNVLELSSPRPDKLAFGAFLDWAKSRYDRVLFLGGGGTDLLSYRYGVKPLASERFQVPEYETSQVGLPQRVRQKEFDFGLYAFGPADPRDGLWFDLDVGVRDDLHVLRFHAKEQTAGRTFRWSRATSYVAVTVVHPTSREVTLWLNDGGRPPSVPPADVSVYLHGQLLGTVRASHEFAPHTLTIPSELAARAAASGDPVELKLITPVWNPHDVLGTPDDRDLGVMVDRVAVR